MNAYPLYARTDQNLRKKPVEILESPCGMDRAGTIQLDQLKTGTASTVAYGPFREIEFAFEAVDFASIRSSFAREPPATSCPFHPLGVNCAWLVAATDVATRP